MDTQAASNAKRDALIERIRKLQRMTTERGASESEAMTAAAFAARLITEHGVEQSELSLRMDAKSCIKDSLISINAKEACWQKIAVGVERLYGTICWLESKKEDLYELGFETEITSLVFYGFPLDVAASIATTAMISVALDTELASAKRKAKGWKQSFEIGFCERVNERLREMRARASEAFRNASKGALVVVKEQVVREEFDKLGQKLYRTRPQNTVKDQAGYAAGQAAGARVGLDSKISNSAGGAQRRLA